MKIVLKKDMGTLIPYSQEDKERLDKLSDGIYQIDIKNMDMRTIKQNASYWKWCTMIAETLNNNGLYLNDILKIETMWNKDNIHANIMLPVIKDISNKTSTTKLNKKEYNNIMDAVIKAFGAKGIQIPLFPSRDLWDEQIKQ